MQTFLPYDSFSKSAQVLDNKRLGKQRVEAYQILKILLALRKDPTAKIAWRNHPAVRMWILHELSLIGYIEQICGEWKRRGFKDSIIEKVRNLEIEIIEKVRNLEIEITLQSEFQWGEPYWFGDPAFHASHRSNLLRKLPDHYRQFWPDEPNNLPYIWPVSPSVITLMEEAGYDRK